MSKIDLALALHEKNKRRARGSFEYFVRATKHDFQFNWHHAVMFNKLQRFADGHIQNLIIEAPPRHTKSELVSRRLPAYMMGIDPAKTFIIGSYAQTLASAMNRDVQRIIDSPTYNEIFPNTVLSESQFLTKPSEAVRNNKKFEVCEPDGKLTGGGLLSVGRGAGVTGFGGQVVSIDDPIKNREEASSTRIRDLCWDWLQNDILSRLEGRKQILLTATRWHEDDLIGKVIAEMSKNPEFPRFEVLTLQAIRSEEFDKLPEDPRNIGDALWPERYNLEFLNQRKSGLGRDFESLYQQNPAPIEGALVKRQWWKHYKELPKDIKRIAQFWDCAQKVGLSNDYSVCSTWAESDTGYYLINVHRGKHEAPELERVAVNLAAKHKPNAIVIEDKSSGSSLIQYMQRNTRLPVVAFNPKGDKELRLIAATPTIQAGNCHLPIGQDWVEDFILEHERFPNAKHDDQCFAAGTMIATLFGNIEIEKIRIGDKIITPYGIDTVSACGATGLAETICFNGTTVTPAHRYFSESHTGFVPAESFHTSCINNLSQLCLLKWKYRKLLYSMESSTDSWGRENITSVSQQIIKKEKILKDFMWRFGNFIQRGQSQKAFTFIISTATLTTTTFLIWNTYRVTNITKGLVKKWIETNNSNIWKKLGRFLSLGTLHKREENGTAKMENKQWPKDHSSMEHAYSVEQLSKANTNSKDSATSTAVKNTGTIVYNLTVERSGCYYANMALVSNCDTTSMMVEYFNKPKRTLRVRAI